MVAQYAFGVENRSMGAIAVKFLMRSVRKAVEGATIWLSEVQVQPSSRHRFDLRETFLLRQQVYLCIAMMVKTLHSQLTRLRSSDTIFDNNVQRLVRGEEINDIGAMRYE